MKTLRKELLAASPQPSLNTYTSERLPQEAQTLHTLRTLTHLEEWFHVRKLLTHPRKCPQFIQTFEGGSLGIKNHSAVLDHT